MKTSVAPRSRRRGLAGFSMIEVLVALVIFSFGMLGLAGLQTRLLTYSQSSLLRSQATALTDDIFDRMRVDRPNVIAGAWDTALEDRSDSITLGPYPYQFDLKDWKAEVERLLPEGQAQISFDAAQGNLVIVKIQWRDLRRDVDSTNPEGLSSLETRSRM